MKLLSFTVFVVGMCIAAAIFWPNRYEFLNSGSSFFYKVDKFKGEIVGYCEAEGDAYNTIIVECYSNAINIKKREAYKKAEDARFRKEIFIIPSLDEILSDEYEP